MELNCPEVYEKPINGMRVVRVDLLECLRESLGDNCFIYRDLLYKLLSGSCSREEHVKLFQSYYRRYQGVTSFVNEIYYYGESEIPIIPRVLQTVREALDAYRESVVTALSDAGGKYLTITHDYVYFAFKGNNQVPDMKGIKIIC